MTIPEIGRQDAVLQFVFWGDIAVMFKQALKERSRLCESWLCLWFNYNLKSSYFIAVFWKLNILEPELR